MLGAGPLGVAVAAVLRDLKRQESRPARSDQSEIDRAIASLKDLGAALAQANPGEMKELLSSFVSRIELHFKDAQKGRRKREFTHGTMSRRDFMERLETESRD